MSLFGVEQALIFVFSRSSSNGIVLERASLKAVQILSIHKKNLFC